MVEPNIVRMINVRFAHACAHIKIVHIINHLSNDTYVYSRIEYKLAREKRDG